MFLGYRITSINPIGINIDGSREVVDSALELLIADLTGELADAGLLVELDSDRFLVVTEQARERRGERFVPFLALGLFGGLLSLPLYGGWLVLWRLKVKQAGGFLTIIYV